MGYKKEFHIEEDKDAFQKRIEKAAEKYRKDMEVPGFRKGHAPLGLIRLRYSKYLENEAVQTLFEEKMKETMDEYLPFVYGNPHIENLDVSKDKGVSFNANLEVPPEIDIDFDKIKLDGNPEDRIEKAIDKEIEKLRKINAEAKSVKRKAKKGDIVFIDIMDGKNTIPSFSVTIGEDPFFTKYLRGVKKEEELDIETKFPADFPVEKLRNNEGKVHILVKDVKGLKLPGLTDNFAKDMGFDNLKNLRETLREQIEKENEGKFSDEETRVLEKIEEQIDIEPPDSLLNSFLKETKDEKIAKKMAKQTMILDAIALKHHLEVSDEKLAEEIDKILEGRENISDEQVEIIGNLVKANFLRKEALNFILKEVKK